MEAATDTAFPAFFAEAPIIRMIDPLADFLGAARHGEIEYRYEDAVRLAGHSCPTVAGAFLMTRTALKALYPDTLPVRGKIRVELRDAVDDGVAGVIGSVAGLLTGAAGAGGFPGIGGRFSRRGLLDFGAPVAGQLRFTRLDTGEAVGVSCHLQTVAADPRMPDLLVPCVRGLASPQEQDLFRALWQDRVRRLLVEHADDPGVFVLDRAFQALAEDVRA
jgi:hypothetical protein